MENFTPIVHSLLGECSGLLAEASIRSFVQWLLRGERGYIL